MNTFPSWIKFLNIFRHIKSKDFIEKNIEYFILNQHTILIKIFKIYYSFDVNWSNRRTFVQKFIITYSEWILLKIQQFQIQDYNNNFRLRRSIHNIRERNALHMPNSYLSAYTSTLSNATGSSYFGFTLFSIICRAVNTRGRVIHPLWSIAGHCCLFWRICSQLLSANINKKAVFMWKENSKRDLHFYSCAYLRLTENNQKLESFPRFPVLANGPLRWNVLFYTRKNNFFFNFTMETKIKKNVFSDFIFLNQF